MSVRDRLRGLFGSIPSNEELRREAERVERTMACTLGLLFGPPNARKYFAAALVADFLEGPEGQAVTRELARTRREHELELARWTDDGGAA